MGVFCLLVTLGAAGYWRYAEKVNNEVDAKMGLGAAVFAGILAVVFFAGHFWLGRNERLWAGWRKEFPEEPWKWWPGWRSGIVRPRVNSWVYLWWLVTALVAGVFAGFLQEESLTAGVKIFVVILGVALIALAGMSANITWRWWRGRNSILRLVTFPVPAGGRMEAMVTLPYRLRPPGGFQLRLLRIHRKLVVTNEGSNTREEEVQRVEVMAQAMETGPEAAHSTTLPVGIQLPVESMGGDPDPTGHGFHWRLQVRAEIPGENLLAEFPVPVFRVAQQ